MINGEGWLDLLEIPTNSYKNARRDSRPPVVL
jgi:hypothetical protein